MRAAGFNPISFDVQDVDRIVIGAGISGLSVAAWLAMQEAYVLVLEKHRHVGGLLPPAQGWLSDRFLALLPFPHTTFLIDDLVQMDRHFKAHFFPCPQDCCTRNPHRESPVLGPQTARSIP